jgi:anti-sigma factor RsiW
MTCPDEDTYARLLQGMLPSDELARLEAHLDGCPACAELLAELGKAYANPTSAAPGPSVSLAPSAPAPAPDTSSLTRIELFAAVVHLALSVKLAWLLMVGLGQSLLASPTPVITAGLIAYALLSGPIGAAGALVSAWGLRRELSWGRRAAIAHAVLSLPSLVLTPLGIYVLVRHRSLEGTATKQRFSAVD